MCSVPVEAPSESARDPDGFGSALGARTYVTFDTGVSMITSSGSVRLRPMFVGEVFGDSSFWTIGRSCSEIVALLSGWMLGGRTSELVTPLRPRGRAA